MEPFATDVVEPRALALLLEESVKVGHGPIIGPGLPAADSRVSTADESPNVLGLQQTLQGRCDVLSSDSELLKDH